MFVNGEVAYKAKGRLASLACVFEAAGDDPSAYAAVVDAAAQFRDMLKADRVSLNMAEKLQVIKSLTRIKVRALRLGKRDGYKTFRTLDAISGDLLQML